MKGKFIFLVIAMFIAFTVPATSANAADNGSQTTQAAALQNAAFANAKTAAQLNATATALKKAAARQKAAANDNAKTATNLSRVTTTQKVVAAKLVGTSKTLANATGANAKTAAQLNATATALKKAAADQNATATANAKLVATIKMIVLIAAAIIATAAITLIGLMIRGTRKKNKQQEETAKTPAMANREILIDPTAEELKRIAVGRGETEIKFNLPLKEKSFSCIAHIADGEIYVSFLGDPTRTLVGWDTRRSHAAKLIKKASP